MPAATVYGHQVTGARVVARPVSLSLVRQALVVCCLLGVYTNISTSVGPSRLYGAIAVAAGLLLLVTRPPRKARFYDAVLMLTVLLAVIIVGGPSPGIDPVITTTQFAVSILAAYGFARELLAWPTEHVRNLALISASVVCVLALAENYLGAVKSLSDSFRLHTYGSLFLYDSDMRDQAFSGIVRPKAFTQEPSHPAKFVAVMITAWFLLSKPHRRWLTLGVLFGAAMFAMRSPSLLICPIVVAYATIAGRDLHAGTLKRWGRMFLVAVLFAGAITMPAWAGQLPFERAHAIGSGEDASTIVRFNAPAKATGDVLRQYPFFGLGIHDGDQADEVRTRALSSFSSISSGAVTQFSETGWGNGFLQMIAFTGIIGGGLLLLWLTRFARQEFGVRDTACVLVVLVAVLSVDGGFSLSRPWFYVFMLLVAFAHRRRIATPTVSLPNERPWSGLPPGR